MNKLQLKHIEDFTKKYYEDMNDYHDWNHILMVKRDAMRISVEFRNQININCLIAACYIHDIGRQVKDEGHPDTSMEIAVPFLKNIKVRDNDIKLIDDAVRNHDKDRISNAHTLEAKILFDADKLQILSVFGFLRVSYWLTAERNMGMNEVVNFLWKYCQEVRKNHIQTKTAKKIVGIEFKKLKRLVRDFRSWQKV